MLNEEAREQLAEILVNRIDDINSKILKEIGDKILAISLIKPSEAYQLGQILKYGGDFKKIAEELAKLTGKNVEDIYKIFEEVAKSNKQFAKEFYKYRNVEYIPYKKDIALQNQVRSIASITAGLYRNISRTTAIGYIVDGKFRNIQDTYNELIDKAIISIVQGKDGYYSSMRKTLTQLGNRGMVTYESGKTRRLDSAIRMNVMDGIRAVNNETNKRFGEEYGADGVEISVHSYPAPDHAEAQGRQLSNEEFDKLQLTGYAKDVKGRNLDLHLNSLEHRPISELNCYHEPFNIVIGISKPLYTDEQLKKIQEENEKGFDFDGKHYTLYEGTQLQRRLELEAKKHKEATILLRASGDKEGLAKEELKVRKITRKYNDLNKASGLPSKKERMSVSGYVRTPVLKTNDVKSKEIDFSNFRSFIDKTELKDIRQKFDYDKFMETYDKFYNTINKEDLTKLKSEMKNQLPIEWKKEGHPIGKYLNKKLKYDSLPEMIDEKDFWIDTDTGRYIADHDATFLDTNHYFRGISGENAEKYIEQFKTGEYYAGQGINGNGTYVTNDFAYAKRYTEFNGKDIYYDVSDYEKQMLFILPKENAKIGDWDKIKEIQQGIYERHLMMNKDSVQMSMAYDEGYLAEILGYDMLVRNNEMGLVLNRGAIKVVK